MAKIIHTNVDLKKNALSNARVKDTPENRYDIVNKEYLDAQVLFDTPNKTKTSTKFPWVSNIADNSVKQILDKLLFPVIYPTYENPVFKNIKVINTNPGKSIATGQVISGQIQFELYNPDRPKVDDAVLNILDVNGIVTHTFNVENIFDTKINFQFLLNEDIKYFELVQNFEPVILKYDSNGQQFIDTDFASSYTLKYKFPINEYLSDFNVIENVLYKVITDIKTQESLNSLLESSDFFKQSLPEYKQVGFRNLVDSFNLNQNENNILLLIIDTDYLHKNLVLDIESNEINDNYSQSIRLKMTDIVISGSNKKPITFIDNNREFCMLLFEIGYPSKSVQLKINIH